MFAYLSTYHQCRKARYALKTVLTVLLLLSLLPLDIIKVFAASKSLGMTPVARASGVTVDAFAVNEMIIERLKPRTISQTALRDLARTILPEGSTNSRTAAELIDDFLRLYGLPASRQNASSSLLLQSLIRTNIDANLPVALVGTDHQVVVDGYNDTSGFGVHVLDPATGQSLWSSISGVVLSNPGFVIQEIVTVFSSVNVKTADYGTLTYSVVSNTLTGGTPPSSSVLKEAIKSAAPYTTATDTVYVINYGSGTSDIGLYAAVLNPNQWGGIALIQDVLRSWDRDSFGDLANFPLFPLDNNGYVDISALDQDIRNLGLIYSTYPNSTTLASYSKLSAEEIQGLIDEHNHFFLNHNYVENRQAVFITALREMVSYKGQLTPEEMAEDHLAFSSYLLGISKVLVEMGYVVNDQVTITKSIAYIVDPDVLRGIVWRDLYKSGYSATHASEIADQVKAKHIATRNLVDHIPGEFIELGLDGVEQLLLAAEPVVFLKETRDELVAVQARLGTSGDDALLRTAITQIVGEIDGQSSVFWAQLGSYWSSGQMLADLAHAAFSATMEFMSTKAIAWGIPFVGQFYFALSVGLKLGDAFTQNQSVHDKLHMALYAKDFEAIFHRVAYTELRPTLITEYQSAAVSKNDLSAWSSAVHLTYLSEAYYWKNIKDAFNSTGFLTNLLTWFNGYGTAHAAANDYFLPEAVTASKYAARWEKPTAVQVILDTTKSLLFDRRAGAVIAQIITPKDGLALTGSVQITYLAEAVAAPVDISLDVDGSTLDTKNNVNPDHYQYIWNSSAFNDGLPHALHLTVTDNNGATAEDTVTVVVGSPGNSNVTPTIELLGPNNEKAFRYYIVNWSDYDPDDNAVISLGYDSNNTGCDGTIIQNWISEDWTTNWWTWRNLPGPSGSSYWVYATIKDDLHDARCVYSPGKLTIETPSSANGYGVDHIQVQDDTYGDGDGIWESEERVDLRVYIKNNTATELNDVYGVVSASSTSIAINDSDATIWAATPGVVRDGVFELTSLPGFSGNVPIQLDIYYRENGGALKKDTETINVTVSPIGSEPNFLINGITFDDSDLAQADGDKVPESGEDNIHTTITLKNNGGATASNVTAVVSQPEGFSGRWANPSVDYPDLAPGQSAGPLDLTLRLDDIPADFSGNLNQTLTVYYGVDQQFSKSVNFTVTIQAVPRIKLTQQNFDFGVVSPGTQVTHDFPVTNIGTQAATITGVSSSHTDLSFVNSPTSIAPGATETFHAILNTTGLDSSITRTFTIQSNAHLLSKNVGTIVGTVHDSLQSSYQVLFSDIPSSTVNEIGAGDSDGDGLKEIFAADLYLDPTTSANYALLIVYEQTSASADTYQEIWRSPNTAMPGAYGTNDIAVGDVNGDGKTDIIVVTGSDNGGKVYFVRTSGSNTLTISTIYSQTGHWLHSVAIGNGDKDSFADILVGDLDTTASSYKSYAFVLEFVSGTTFSKRWTSPALIERAPGTGEAPVCSLSISDSDKDTYPELILGTEYGQIKIFENTSGNTYNSTLKLDRVLASALDSSLSGDCDLTTGDFDGDGMIDIAYGNDDSNELWIVENGGNDTWPDPPAWRQSVAPASTNDFLSVASGDTNGDGIVDLSLSYRGSPAGFRVYQAFQNNSYAPLFSTTGLPIVEDDIDAIGIFNVNQDSLPELLFAHAQGFTIVGLAKDLLLNSMVLDPNVVTEGIQTSLTASISNISGQSLSDIGVSFYNGDPSSGGSLLGTTTIPSLANGTSALASINQSFSTAGAYAIYAMVDPNNAINEGNENNNKKSTPLTVVDNDQDPPQISNISISEYMGDGDGLLEDDEQLVAAWTTADPSGIASTNLTVDCPKGSVTSSGNGNYQIILGTCTVGVHSFSIAVTDNDNSPATRNTPADSFQVVNHQPVINSVSPANTATNVSRNTSVQASFATAMNATSITAATFTLETLGGTSVMGSAVYDPVLKKATFIPAGRLAAQTTYRAILHGGPDGIRDANNNPLDSNFVWQFTTLPNQSPATPYLPLPSNGASNIPINTSLSWQAYDLDNDVLTFTVYFGSTNPPTVAICSNIQTFACDPGQLSENQTYYWQVWATDGTLSIQSAAWSFTTHAKSPEMDMVVQSGDTSPDLADGTDFGSVQKDGETVSHSFTILNTGDADLNLTGSPVVAISGPNASDFSIAIQPANKITPNNTTTLDVDFDPGALGTRTAIISISNNDPDENPYTFKIQGTGITLMPNNVDVYIGGMNQASYYVPAYGNLRPSFAGVNNGPVRITSIDNSKIVASERVAYSPDGGNTWTSYSELMGMPGNQLTSSYTFPWYNNVDLNSQLRFGNVGNTNTTITVTIAGRIRGTYYLTPNQSTRVSYGDLNSGPVKVASSGNVPIIASLRVAHSNGGTWTSFSEMMGFPSTKLTTSYTFPWYNNVDLNTQLRFGNVGISGTTVTVTVGGVMKGTYVLAPNASQRVSYQGLNNGPVKVTSSGGVPIIASIRVAYTPDNGATWPEFSEMMGLPTSSLSTSYSFPVYNNVDHNTQIRFGNVGTAGTDVTVTIGGVVQGVYPLLPNQSTRISYPSLDSGPIVITSSGGVKIIASERVAYFDTNISKWTSFAEMMGLPKEQLTTSYIFPWYNNVDLDTQVRFGVP